jgi:hypothetical protein
MFRGRGYERIEEESDQHAHEEQLLTPQYEIARRPFPKKEIIWGIIMLVIGIVLVGLGLLVHFEHWENRVPGMSSSFGMMSRLVDVCCACVHFSSSQLLTT